MDVITKTLPTYTLSGWDLSELLPDASEEQLSARLAGLDAAVAAFERRRADLDPRLDPRVFLSILRQYEELHDLLQVINGYASLWFYSNTGSQEALTFRNRVRQAATETGNRVLFFTLWWCGLSDDESWRLLPSETEHRDYRQFLQNLRRFKPYTLDEKSEQIINVKDQSGADAVTTLYSMLTNRLEFNLTVDGESRRLTRDELMSHAFSPDAGMRETAYQELYRVYSNEANILGQVYANVVRNWHDEQVVLRGFPSPIAVRNLDNDVPDRAVQVLLEVARENVGIFQRYFRMKAGWLGLPKLRRYDLYAPLASSDRKVDYSDAVRSVLETFDDFHPRLSEYAQRVFAERHLDGEIRKGKRGGAFCYTVLPRYTPWVLVNFAGRVRDVATLAHELGHAIHSMLAGGCSSLTQHASLPLAETASVFAEMLMTDRLLREEPDPLARRELLAAAVDDVYATVLRQAYFVLFEIEAHEAIRAGRSTDELAEIYMGKLREQFGDSVDLAPEFRYEWLSIPHIYQTPFYCYAYSFGQLLVLALYRRFQEEGEAFKPGYLRLLSYGGSARPEQILAEVGIDMTDRSFWQGGFDLVREQIDTLETMKL